MNDFYKDDTKLQAHLVLRQGAGQIRTFRSGFGLATVGVATVYGFGGAINIPMLEPTAGREALSTASMTFLQGIVRVIESWVSERFAKHPVSDKNIRFIEWARLNGRPDLCSQLQLRKAPSDERIHSGRSSESYCVSSDAILRGQRCTGCSRSGPLRRAPYWSDHKGIRDGRVRDAS